MTTVQRPGGPSRVTAESQGDAARPANRFRARRWPLRLAALVVFGMAATLMWWANQRTNAATFRVLPAPSGIASAASIVPAKKTPSASKPTAGADTGAHAVATPHIADSPAVQIYIPGADKALTISTSVNPLSHCRTVIDPPHSGPDFGGVFGCTDFAQPGTAAPSLAVLAGHSAKGINTAFNRLYVQGQSLKGREVFVRTQASGKRWLVYRIQAVYSPDKKNLPYLTAVWGGDGSSTAGRLVVVTCRQDAATPTATHNYVAVAQLEGVR